MYKSTCAMAMAIGTIGACAASAHADHIGNGFVIPDNSAVGGQSSIIINDAGTVPMNFMVSITFGDPAHTWSGDLIGQLSHFNGVNTVTIDLFRRIGKLTLNPTDFGNPNDLNGQYRFSDFFTTPFWNPQTQEPGPTIIPGDYRATTNMFNGGQGPLVSLDAAFTGRSWAGTWTLKITDNSAGDTGAVVSWSLGVVPAPGALAMLACAMLGARRRRR